MIGGAEIIEATFDQIKEEKEHEKNKWSLVSEEPHNTQAGEIFGENMCSLARVVSLSRTTN